ncbi:MAG TPA: S-formylglutathione hydrolase [Castellaniella sp.]|uniref:S-formylglutathione hydrolase n=1 Tax=Castellaniella sp. TaxID=1955812 RepID=UPI002EED2355
MLELTSRHGCFGGEQRFYKHDSIAIGLPMRFSVFVPPQAVRGEPVPALLFLAGLTANEETFALKAGAQRVAAELGLMLLSPDTSPRDAHVPGEDQDWDLGLGAGFYLNATTPGWSTAYRMENYVAEELPELLQTELGANDRLGIFGHSMGGHGALTLALKHPDLFRSVSAFAPIAAPSRCPWGKKAFTAYLGDDQSAWEFHDASALMAGMRTPFPKGILVDQGLDDRFLAEGQLLPEVFEKACRRAQQPLTLNRREGYDHGYYFVSTMMESHLRFHAEQLGT